MIRKEYVSFKPYYKWNTFNTERIKTSYKKWIQVLNLIINGIPSILWLSLNLELMKYSFKPYYKWNTFNTLKGIDESLKRIEEVLNLIINGIPSIPSINSGSYGFNLWGFKPYYKWNTFNTDPVLKNYKRVLGVLNLIINGIPSILQ